MSFKIKALAAAIALAGAVGQASAAGQNDVLFFVYNNTAGVSYVYDIGSTFNPTTDTINSLNVAVGADWASFTSAVGANSASNMWGVIENMGSNRVGGTLAAGATFAATNPTNMATIMNNLTGALTGVSVGGTHYGVGTGFDNLVGTFVTPGGIGNWNGNGWNSANLVSAGAIDVAFKSALPGARGSVTLTSYTPSNGNGFAFDGANLSYNVAAVPEPETYGMLVAGLLMLGAVARRRRV